MTEEWRTRCAAAPGVSRETLARLDLLVDRLTRWNPTINLVAASTVHDVWRRHVLDSAQLWPLAPVTARRWADLGSGGGFPGLVIAAIAATERPALRITLVESDARKAAFLAEAARAMDVDPEIRVGRIERLPPTVADVVSARALAPLARLLELAAPWLAPAGVALFSKGASVAAELTAVGSSWHSASRLVPSVTDPKGAILVMTELRRV